MLENALLKINQQLNAKETKHFAFQGSVMDTREVEAHSIQQGAARLIVEMAEILIKGQPKPPARKTRIVIDPKTGVMSIIIDEEYAEGEAGDQPAVIDVTPVPQPQPVPQIQQIPETEEEEVSDADFEQIIKVPRGELSPTLRQALFGPPKVGNGEQQ